MTLFIIAGMLGPWQIVLIVIVVILLFGGRKIPELMKGLGQGMKEFKNATKDMKKDKEDEIVSEKDDSGEEK
ncbi:MAG: twin-arginine translocase TatA/TatE family subunit [Bacteroidales bacterium]|nr:twin-arginine translocase TatA/TatE family subunit [Bacteroidales bacterium]